MRQGARHGDRNIAGTCFGPSLIAGASSHGPAPEALRVIERLSHSGPRPKPDIAEVRRCYKDSRRPLLAPLADVESVVHVRSGPHNSPPLWIIRPAGFTPGLARPGLVYLHGGGWTVGDFETYEPFCRQLANALGAVIVFVEYRLAPEHPFPAAYEDARIALQWVVRNSAWLGIDPARVGIGGDSAGGNLAAAIALEERDASTRLWLQLLLYPCLDLTACLELASRVRGRVSADP